MKKELNQKIVGLDGIALKEQITQAHQNPATMPDLTFGVAVAHALVGVFQSEQPAPGGVEKALRFKLASRCMKGGTQDFTPQELVRITDCCNHQYGPLVYGQIEEWANNDKLSVVPLRPQVEEKPADTAEASA